MKSRPGETIREYLGRFLLDHGLWPDQVETVLNGIDNTGLVSVYQEHADGYPEHFLAVSLLTAKTAALDWIDANAPNHMAVDFFGLSPEPEIEPEILCVSNGLSPGLNDFLQPLFDHMDSVELGDKEVWVDDIEFDGNRGSPICTGNRGGTGPSEAASAKPESPEKSK